MKKLALSALLASLMAACATQPPAVTNTATPVDNSATASNPNANTNADATAVTDKAAADKALNEAALKDSQAKTDSDSRMQENLLKANSVYFGFNQFNIDDDYKSIVDTHAAYAKSKGSKVRVEGNTDDRGSREYNLALGQKRANAVASALQVLGVNKSSIETVSFGEEKPRAEGADEDAWSVNRRADIIYPQ